MSVGRFVSLEEVRCNPRLLRRFIRERVDGGNGRGDPELFDRTLDSLIKNLDAAGKSATPKGGQVAAKRERD